MEFLVVTKKNKMLNSKRLEDETNNLFNALKELIRYTIELSSEAMIRKRFEEVYLNENLGCKLNLLDLAYDLNELKKFNLYFKDLEKIYNFSLKKWRNSSSFAIFTALPLLPSNGPTIPSASSSSIILPARL